MDEGINHDLTKPYTTEEEDNDEILKIPLGNRSSPDISEFGIIQCMGDTRFEVHIT